LLDLSAKKSKKPQDWQAYSHIYWDTKLKEAVADEWEVHKQTALDKAVAEDTDEPNFPENAPFLFRNEVIRKLFREESDDVKAEVEKYRDKFTNSEDIQLDTDVDDEAKCVARAK
jgi:hypothetical protein